MNLPILPFAAGILLLQQQEALPAWPWLWMMVLALIMLGVCATRPEPAGRPIAVRQLALCLSALLLGFSWAGWRADLRLTSRLPTTLEGVDLPLRGTIAGLPQTFSRGQRFTLVTDEDDPRLPGTTLHISWYQRSGERMADPVAGQERQSSPPPNLLPGQHWQLVLRLKRPHGHANGAGFDYEAWLLERGVDGTGYVRDSPENRLLGNRHSLGTRIEALRHAVRRGLEERLPAADHPYAGILSALVIGDQQAIPGGQWKIFAATGTTHLMSISGLHVTMIAGLVGWLAGWLWRRHPRLPEIWPAQGVTILAGCAAALAYTLLAGAAVPALRTLAMLVAAALALLSRRHVSSGNVLSFALLAVLLLDPWAPLAPGFWLSFIAVAALLLAAQSAETPRQPTLRQRLTQMLQRWGLAQAVASLATLPLLLAYFQQFSLVSPLANALAIPLVSLVVTPLALLAAALPLAGLAEGTHALLAGLMGVLEFLAALPGARWLPPAPDTRSLLLAALGCAFLFLPRGWPGRWLGLCLLLPLLTTPQPRPPPGSAWVTVLDVGQGLAVAVRTENHTLLYDAGPYYSPESDAGERLVVPWLRAMGVDRIDAMVITHRDWDHSGGARSVLETLPVEQLFDSLPPDSPEARDLQPRARQRQECIAGQRWEWEGVTLSMLHPPAGKVAQPEGKANHQSCVLKISRGSHSILLTSDIEAADEAWLLADAAAELPSTALVVPHHGSRTSSTPAFVAAVKAREVIFPVGYRNRFGHPKEDVVARYAAQGNPRLWRTDRDGAITLVLDDHGVTAEAERQRRPRYWHEPRPEAAP
jgi:competence protein ComEC